ncbi:MAG: hypothetical protein Q9201_004039 [Fulgogasparrea decipioides]
MSISLDVVEAPNVADPDGINLIPELETETGFSSYKAYLEATCSGRRGTEDVLALLEDMRDLDSAVSCCFIMDVNKSKGAADALTIRLNLSSEPDDSSVYSISHVRRFRHSTALELFKGLRSPREDDTVRVVIWYIGGLAIVPEWVDVLGLGLQVPPSFFGALLPKETSTQLESVAEAHFQHPEHLVIGQAVATLLGGSGLNASTILIAHVLKIDSDVLELLELEMDRNLPFDHRRNRRAAEDSLGLEQFCNRSFFHYQRLLRDSLTLGPNGEMDERSLYYTCLLPLLKLCALGVQTKHRRSFEALTVLKDTMGDPLLPTSFMATLSPEAMDRFSRNGSYKALDLARYKLRRVIEECENAQQFFVTHIKSRDNAAWLSGQSYKAMKSYLNDTINVARRLEVEIRDYMQLVVGALSIEESRKSIKLSDTQIQEGKQGLSRPESRR